jgi:hypothetical protein
VTVFFAVLVTAAVLGLVLIAFLVYDNSKG